MNEELFPPGTERRRVKVVLGMFAALHGSLAVFLFSQLLKSLG
jgi:hypothetical protein